MKWVFVSGRDFLLHKLERNEEALAALDKALSFDPCHVESHVGRGETLAKASELLGDRDVPGLSRAQVLRARGSVFWLIGRHDDALDAMDRALALEPDHALAHRDRAVALRQLGRPQEALAAVDQALRLDPKDHQGCFLRSDLLARLGRPKEALAAIDRAIQLAPNRHSRFRRGRILLALDRHEEALAIFDAALASNPGHVAALLNRGVALFGLGRFEEAAMAFERVLELDPGSAPIRGGAQKVLGLAYYRSGRWGDALRALERSMELLGGGDAGTWLYTAMALSKLGRDQKATGFYDKAVALMEQHAPDLARLKPLRAEAEEVLGIKPR